jgi:hypothetical protein
LFVQKGNLDELLGAVGSFDSLLCESIHLHVDTFLQLTIMPFLCFICMQLHVLKYDAELLGSDKVFKGE